MLRTAKVMALMCLIDILSLTFPYPLYPFPAVRTLVSVSARPRPPYYRAQSGQNIPQRSPTCQPPSLNNVGARVAVTTSSFPGLAHGRCVRQPASLTSEREYHIERATKSPLGLEALRFVASVRSKVAERGEHRRRGSDTRLMVEPFALP